MTRTSYPGASYIDEWPDGTSVRLYPSSHIDTHLGRVDLPLGETFGVLYLHCVPGFRFGGQRHDDGQMQEWTEAAGWRPSKPPLSARAVYVGNTLTDIAPAGYQFVDENTGRPISRLVTYGPQNGLSEWSAIGRFDISPNGILTLRGGLQIGQIHDDYGPPGLGLWDGTTLRLIEPGLCTFCNVHRIGENVTLSFAKPGEAIRIDCTMAELRALPPVVQPPVPPAPPVPPVPPVPPQPPQPPVPPTPGPVPVPPKPSLFQPAKGVVMSEPKRVALRLGQMFASVDPAEVGKGPFPGWYPVRFLKATKSSDPHAAFTLAQPRAGDLRLLVRPESVPNAALSIDATEFSGDIGSEFGVKPNVSEADWGGYEALNGWTLQGQGIDIVLVQYDRDGQKYTSACLTVVEL